MSADGTSAFGGRRPANAGDLVSCMLWLLWQPIRLPLFLMLAILEPVVSFILRLLALRGVLTALFWKLAGPPHFPFAMLLGTSLVFGLMLAAYHALLRLLSR